MPRIGIRVGDRTAAERAPVYGCPVLWGDGCAGWRATRRAELARLRMDGDPAQRRIRDAADKLRSTPRRARPGAV
jgi:hypothetical protein